MTTYTVRIDSDYSGLGAGATQETLDGYAENLAAKLADQYGVTVEVVQDLGGRGQCVGPDDEVAEQIHQAVRDIQAGNDWIDLLPEEAAKKRMALSAALSWAGEAGPGDYLIHYEDTGLTDEEDPGSRCGFDDAELDAIRVTLRRRGLTLSADDRGLVAEAHI